MTRLPPGLRALKRHRGLTMMAILGIVLGVAASFFAFSLFSHTAFARLPFENQDRLFTVEGVGKWLPDQRRILAQKGEKFASPIWWNARNLLIDCNGLTELTRSAEISPRFENLFRSSSPNNAEFGRGLSAASGAPATVVVSERFRRRCFSGDAEVIGRKLKVQDQEYEIVGVLPEDFYFPVREEVWLPLKSSGPARGILFEALPDVSREEVQAEIASLLGRDVVVKGYPQAYIGIDQVRIIAMTCAVIGLILLIACFNVSHLVGGRTLLRMPEFAIRRALGATRGQISALVSMETMILAAVGTILAVVPAYLGISVLNEAIEYTYTPFWFDLRLDLRLAFFAVVGFLLTTYLASFAAARRASRVAIAPMLAASVRTHSGGRGTWIRHAVLVLEVIGSCFLLVMTGLLFRLVFEERFPADFPGERLGGTMVHVSDSDLSSAERDELLQDLQASVSALPGVQEVSLTTSSPLHGFYRADAAVVEEADDLGVLTIVRVTPNYAPMLGLSPLVGEDLSRNAAQRVAGVPTEALISEALGRKLGASGRALDLVLRSEEKLRVQVKGVIPNQPLGPWSSGVEAVLYIPMFPKAPEWVSLLIEADDPERVAPELFRTAREKFPGLRIYDFWSWDDLRRRVYFLYRYLCFFFGILALTGLLLVSIGIYGIVDFHARRYERGFAIRRACGATAKHLFALALRRVLPQVLIGLALGMFLCGFLLSRLPPAWQTIVDGWSVWLPAAVLLVVLPAAWGPVRRISRAENLSSLIDR